MLSKLFIIYNSQANVRFLYYLKICEQEVIESRR